MHSVIETNYRTALFSQSAIYFAWATAAYIFINFVWTENHFFPVHQDDWVFLGRGIDDLTWRIERPVMMNIAYLTAAAGELPLFLSVSFLTLAFPALTILFFSRLFHVRFTWWMLATFFFVAFYHPGSFEYGKYLAGVGEWSLLFGMVGLILLLEAYRSRNVAMAALAWLFYTLSAFSKEDFLLPSLILAFFGMFGLIRRDPNEQGYIEPQFNPLMAWSLALSFVAAGASAIFSATLNSRFAGVVQSESGGPYDVLLNVPSLLSTFVMLTWGYIPVESAATVAAVVICWVLLPRKRIEVLIAAAITLSLIAPIMLIPQNLHSYRAFGWLPWFAAIITVALYAMTARLELRLRGGVFAVASIAAVLVVGVYLSNWQERTNIASWYLNTQQMMRQMLASLEDNRDLISSEPVVGVAGLDGLSPWHNNSGAFLRMKLGYPNNWIVFADAGDPYYQPGSTEVSGPAITSIAPIAELCKNPGLLVLEFDETGRGVPRRASQICG